MRFAVGEHHAVAARADLVGELCVPHQQALHAGGVHIEVRAGGLAVGACIPRHGELVEGDRDLVDVGDDEVVLVGDGRGHLGAAVHLDDEIERRQSIGR